jgi:hypothetical protein
MDRNSILNVMEQKAEAIYAATPDYHQGGKRGTFVVSIRTGERTDQWDSSSRNFGAVAMEPSTEVGATGVALIINNGASFDATVHGKVAYARRTGKNSGANYWQVLGTESWWNGAIVSKDGACICAFSGLKGYDDVAIAEAGIADYERQKGI